MKTRAIDLNKVTERSVKHAEILKIRMGNFLLCDLEKQTKMNEYFPDTSVKYFKFFKEKGVSTLNKNIYKLEFSSEIHNQKNIGFRYISLNFWQNQRFLFLQREHWLQKEENIRYLINILFLIVGIVITLKN